MLNKHRFFTRREPERNARIIYIFCEGTKREPQYFRFFAGLDSRIKIEVFNTASDQDNSPTGLFEEAKNWFSNGEPGESSKFDFHSGADQLWFVIDTDLWGEKISVLRALCKDIIGWQVAQSNPCFEVWLYYHFYADKPLVRDCREMKQLLNEKIEGGFNSTRHPVYIDNAISHAKMNVNFINGLPDEGSTEVYLLAEQFFPFIEKKTLNIKRKLTDNH